MNEIAAGVIAKLVEMSDGIEGKKVMQKLVYFLQERGVPLGFKYQLYFYGPYSHELTYAISDFEAFGILLVQPAANNATAYRVGPAANIFTNLNKIFLDRFQPILESVLDTFGKKTSSELELLATIDFIDKSLRGKEEKVNRGRVVELTKKEKAKYSETAINNAYDELVKIGLIN